MTPSQLFHLQFASIVSLESWGSAKLRTHTAGICNEHLSNDSVIPSIGVVERRNLRERAASL